MLRLSLLILLSAPLLAAAEIARPAYVPPADVSSGGMMQVIISLLLVLAAVMAVAWLLKRISAPQQNAGRQLKVISGVAVGQRERVVLVEINDTWLVLGVAAGNVRTLHTLPKSSLPPMESSGYNPDNKFHAWLKQFMEKK
jgi:flagellar protein FliO/FliZ